MFIQYHISIGNPYSHLVHIEMHITDVIDDEIVVAMPVWTPGSYMVREFPRNINTLSATTYEGEALSWEKITKNRWRISSRNIKEMIISYEVYAFELTVRTSYVTDDFFMLNGASIFLFIENHLHLRHEVKITAPHYEEVVSTLNSREGIFWASDYDTLVDNPILGGKFEKSEFISANIPHTVYILEKGNYDLVRLTSDLQKITNTEITMMGGIPCPKYHFYIINTDKIYGGLEHSCCSVNMVPRFNYDKDNYLNTISLLAHEYFHLWNVKTIAPQSLKKFNYNEENYTHLLWFVEGVTSYFDDYFVFSSGVSTVDEYLNILSKNINTVMNSAGTGVQPLADASFDAWIKYYRPNENTPNSQISYYTKGAVIALALHLYLLHKSEAEKGLDDLMRILYSKYLLHPSQGYTKNLLEEWTKECLGISIELFLDTYVDGVAMPPLNELLQYGGAKLLATENAKYLIGYQFQYSHNQCIVQFVDNRFLNEVQELQYGDEIIAVNGFRISDASWEKRLEEGQFGTNIHFLVNRMGIIREVLLPLDRKIQYKFAIQTLENISPLQQKIRNRWL